MNYRLGIKKGHEHKRCLCLYHELRFNLFVLSFIYGVFLSEKSS